MTRTPTIGLTLPQRGAFFDVLSLSELVETGHYADETGLFDTAVVAELETMAAAGRGEFVQRVRGLYRSSAPECVPHPL